jgi:hypothetical protein
MAMEAAPSSPPPGGSPTSGPGSPLMAMETAPSFLFFAFVFLLSSRNIKQTNGTRFVSFNA